MRASLCKGLHNIQCLMRYEENCFVVVCLVQRQPVKDNTNDKISVQNVLLTMKS